MNGDGAARRAGAASDGARADVDRDAWVLQGEAAMLAGCSVSVLRKWRRAGAIAERTRTSSGGMKRVEVRLGDVLDKMDDSMPGRAPGVLRAAAPPVEAPPPPPVPPDRLLGPAGVDVFVQHIVAAERRAATAEAQLKANEVMTELLRERVAALQAQRDASREADPATSSSGGPVGRLAAELRAFRSRVEALDRAAPAHDAPQRAAARLTYDTALICLCVAAGVSTRYALGTSLTSAERSRLAKALADLGVEVTGPVR